MNTKNLMIASLLGAAITTVFSNLPLLNLLNFLICLPFWGGPLFAAWFYKRQTGRMKMNHAIQVGLVTGLLAGILGFLFMAGGFGLPGQVREYLPAGVMPAEYWVGDPSFLFTFSSVVLNILFGVIGGAIAGAIFNKKSHLH